MAHYGDPEAHRCILEEIAARPAAPRLIAYLRAAVMGSQGSDIGIQQLRRFPGAVEQPCPHLKVTLALLSMTILASSATPSFRQEQQRMHELLARERAALVQQGEQLRANVRSNSDGASGGPFIWGFSSSAANVPVNFSSSDISSVSATVAAAAAAAGGISSILTSSGVEEAQSAEEALSPVQRWEQSMDILNYCEAYANYLGGFTVLWYELFGPHYDYTYNRQQQEQQRYQGNVSGARDGDAAEESQSSPPSPASREWASGSSPSLSLPSSPTQHGPQVPPHLFAVRWADILTPQRRAWFQGLHNVVKELLVRILSRELPLELYALFIQYANLSLRVYLLQTLAEVFEWTSHYLDVLCYVHVMRQSYSIQCEMSELQRTWAAFGLFDNRFIDDCREFNKMYTESQGAFSEQQLMVGQTQAVSGGAAVPSAGEGGKAGRRPSPLSCGAAAHMRAGPHSANGNGKVAPAATLGLRAPLTFRTVDDSAAAAADGTGGAMQRMFPLRGTVGNASSDAADAAHSSASSSPDDEALSSASDTAAAAGDARRTKRAVYLPLFYTCCCFTWILQRSFWSMFGRSSLLLESCLGHEVTPQVLRADVTAAAERGGGNTTLALFTATPLGARRRGAAAASSTTSAQPRATPMANLTRPPPAPGTTTTTSAGPATHSDDSGGDRRGGAAAASTASPNPPAAQRDAGAMTTTAGAGRPPQASRTPQPPSPSQQQQSQAAVAAQQAPASTTSASSQRGGGGQPATTTASSIVNAPLAANTHLSSSSSVPIPRSSSSISGSSNHNNNGSGERTGLASRWGALLGILVPRRHFHHGNLNRQRTRNSTPSFEVRHLANEEATDVVASPAARGCSSSLPTLAASQGPSRSEGASAAGTRVENEEDAAADNATAATVAAASVSLTCSGAPFFLQYTHRAREVQLYEDPSASFRSGGGGDDDDADTDAGFFEEFHFLRETGCYVLSHALRNLICYPRYPVTLLIFTDNTHRPGRVSWCDHKFSVLSSSVDDKEERRGLTPWVLCAVIPHTRLSSDGATRAQQEERLLQHVVFQVAGAKTSRVRFCTPNSVFYALNGGADVDGGRLYFALHLHVPQSNSEGGTVPTEQVMREESKWAFRELGELQCSWAMPCTCNEALRVAFQVGPVDGQTVEI